MQEQVLLGNALSSAGDPDFLSRDRWRYSLPSSTVARDDLLNTYTRLKGLSIEPVLTMDHGPTIAFYYQDPDRNSVELCADAFGDWDQSRQFTQSSPEFHQNPMGTPVDADQLVTARQAGMSLAELHQRAYAGEFRPARPVNPRVLL